MKKIFLHHRALWVFVSVSLMAIYSCKKEASVEDPNNPGGDVVIGANCRVSKIAFADSLLGFGTGSVSAVINALDTTTSVTAFDSLLNIASVKVSITYASDTAKINANEYFLLDPNKRVARLHALEDTSNPASKQIDIDYIYDGNGRLMKKSHSYTLDPNVPFQEVNYTYAANNLTKMEKMDLIKNELIQDADIIYDNAISPKNYLYLFPDEKTYATFNQFFNFGTKSINLVKSIKVRNFDPGNMPKDSTLSTFGNYVLSVDRYVLSATMSGDSAYAIPAKKGRLKFSYKCKP
jgi:hypothetical protein